MTKLLPPKTELPLPEDFEPWYPSLHVFGIGDPPAAAEPQPLPSQTRFMELTRLVGDELQKLEGLEFGISRVYGDSMNIVLWTPDGARRWPRIRIRKIDEAAIDGSLATLVEKVVLDMYPDFVVKPR